MSIGVILPTYNSAQTLEACLEQLLASEEKFCLFWVDSSSTDHTRDILRSFAGRFRQCEGVVIAQSLFGHGKTREWARRQLDTDFVVMMTPDALLASRDAFTHLLEPLRRRCASVSYGRQLPRPGASWIEALPRMYNYPETSHIRSMKDRETYGSYLPFCSHSFAAYRNDALEAIGGIVGAEFGEDTLTTARLLLQGHSVAYTARACCVHSHHFTLRQEWQRHRKIGALHRHELWKSFASPGKRGRDFSLFFLQNIMKRSPDKLPYAVMVLMVKYFAFRFGLWTTRR